MHDKQGTAADSTAVRVALWRAMHVQVDPPPHVLEDELGLRLAAPDEGWRRRPDMDPQATSHFRASIVARARFIEDLVVERAGRGVRQYVILGAGLDTFAQRRPEVASGLRVFEVDQPGPQAWKRQRLIELDFGTLESVRFQSSRDEDVGINNKPERDHPRLGFCARAALMTWSIWRELSLSVPLRCDSSPITRSTSGSGAASRT